MYLPTEFAPTIGSEVAPMREPEPSEYHDATQASLGPLNDLS
jgi:hypothetical protein